MSVYLQHKKFQISDDGFRYKDIQYSFDNVLSIFFNRVVTKQRLNLINVGEPESAGLLIKLLDGKKIKLSVDESSFIMGFNRNKKEEIFNLIKIYKHLSEASFESRIQRYLSQTELNGYFEYEGCRFYPGEKIVVGGYEYTSKNTSFTRRNGYIELEIDENSSFGSMKSPNHFNTQWDLDVIIILMNKFFHLR